MDRILATEKRNLESFIKEPRPLHAICNFLRLSPEQHFTIHCGRRVAVQRNEVARSLIRAIIMVTGYGKIHVRAHVPARNLPPTGSGYHDIFTRQMSDLVGDFLEKRLGGVIFFPAIIPGYAGWEISFTQPLYDRLEWNSTACKPRIRCGLSLMFEWLQNNPRIIVQDQELSLVGAEIFESFIIDGVCDVCGGDQPNDGIVCCPGCYMCYHQDCTVIPEDRTSWECVECSDPTTRMLSAIDDSWIDMTGVSNPVADTEDMALKRHRHRRPERRPATYADMGAPDTSPSLRQTRATKVKARSPAVFPNLPPASPSLAYPDTQEALDRTSSFPVYRGAASSPSSSSYTPRVAIMTTPARTDSPPRNESPPHLPLNSIPAMSYSSTPRLPATPGIRDRKNYGTYNVSTTLGTTQPNAGTALMSSPTYPQQASSENPRVYTDTRQEDFEHKNFHQKTVGPDHPERPTTDELSVAKDVFHKHGHQSKRRRIESQIRGNEPHSAAQPQGRGMSVQQSMLPRKRALSNSPQMTNSVSKYSDSESRRLGYSSVPSKMKMRPAPWSFAAREPPETPFRSIEYPQDQVWLLVQVKGSATVVPVSFSCITSLNDLFALTRHFPAKFGLEQYLTVIAYRLVHVAEEHYKGVFIARKVVDDFQFLQQIIKMASRSCRATAFFLRVWLLVEGEDWNGLYEEV